MLVFGVELCMSKYHIEVKPRMAQTSVLIQPSVVPLVIRARYYPAKLLLRARFYGLWCMSAFSW